MCAAPTNAHHNAQDEVGGALRSVDVAVPLPRGAAGHGVLVVDADAACAVLHDTMAAVDGAPGIGAVAQRRAEFLAGRWCAARALGALGGGGTVGRTREGAPVWPRGFVGSITHSHGRVVAVAAESGAMASIGLDVERLVTDAVADELAPRVLGVDERRVLEHAVDAGGPAFTLGFSAKEALYKCLYPVAGEFMDFDAARVVAADGATLTLALTREWAPTLPAGRRLVARYARTAHGVETVVVLGADGEDAR